MRYGYQKNKINKNLVLFHFTYKNKEKPRKGFDYSTTDFYKENFNLRFFMISKGLIILGTIIFILCLWMYFLFKS